MSAQPVDSTPTAGPSTTGIRPGRARVSVIAPRARVPAAAAPVLWGAVFLLGGMAVFSTVPRTGDPLAEPWKASTDPTAAAREMMSAVHASAGEAGLLKLEWPAHPEARGYRVRFRDPQGHVLAPVTVDHNVFLYDLESDVLGLPDDFEWQVSAVLRDGTEVVTPPKVHSAR